MLGTLPDTMVGLTSSPGCPTGRSWDGTDARSESGRPVEHAGAEET